MPPSDMAILIVGYALSTRDHSRSAAQFTQVIGCTVIITSTGASAEVTTIWDDEPRCMRINRRCSRRAFPTFWSTAARASPWAWPARFRRTIYARSWRHQCAGAEPRHHAAQNRGDRAGSGFSNRRNHSGPHWNRRIFRHRPRVAESPRQAILLLTRKQMMPLVFQRILSENSVSN